MAQNSHSAKCRKGKTKIFQFPNFLLPLYQIWTINSFFYIAPVIMAMEKIIPKLNGIKLPFMEFTNCVSGVHTDHNGGGLSAEQYLDS